MYVGHVLLCLCYFSLECGPTIVHCMTGEIIPSYVPLVGNLEEDLIRCGWCHPDHPAQVFPVFSQTHPLIFSLHRTTQLLETSFRDTEAYRLAAGRREMSSGPGQSSELNKELPDVGWRFI